MDGDLRGLLPDDGQARQEPKLMRAFDGFQFNNAIFASIWLVFLGPVLIQVYTGDEFGAGDKTWVTACVLIFSAVYFYAFCSMSTSPRGWRPLPPALPRWGGRLAIALTSAPVIHTGALIFTPYLAALRRCTPPPTRSPP